MTPTTPPRRIDCCIPNRMNVFSICVCVCVSIFVYPVLRDDCSGSRKLWKQKKTKLFLKIFKISPLAKCASMCCRCLSSMCICICSCISVCICKRICSCVCVYLYLLPAAVVVRKISSTEGRSNGINISPLQSSSHSQFYSESVAIHSSFFLVSETVSFEIYKIWIEPIVTLKLMFE